MGTANKPHRRFLLKIRYILLPLSALLLAGCTAQPAIQPVTLVPSSTASVMPTTTETTTEATTTTSTTTEQSPATEEIKPHGRRGEFCSQHGAVSVEGYVCTYKGKAWRWE